MRLTFCLMTCGEETEQECLAAVASHRNDFVFQEVRNLAPQTIALNTMIEQCQTEFLVPLDADFILYKDYWARMNTAIDQHKQNKNWHSILFPLWEELTQRKVRSIKIFRTAIVKKIPYQHVRHPDAFHFQELKSKGYYAVDLFEQDSIGEHVIRGHERCYFKFKDWFLCLRKVKTKQEVHAKAKDFLTMFEKLYTKTQNDDYLYCIAGLYDGFTDQTGLNTSKNAFEKNMRIDISEVPKIKRIILKQILL